MRVPLAVAGLALSAALSAGDDKGTVVEWAGLRSAAPASWKEETPTSKMRLAQFKVPKAEGDKEDAEVAVFVSPGGGGVDANLKRQLAVFTPDKGKDKVEEKTDKVKVGPHDATYQDLKGTLLKKAAPLDPNSKVTPQAGYRQLYVIFETPDKAVASLWLRGPEKTVEANKKAFDEWVKNFK
ncbi:MAG: hypothetical protein K2X87_24505 [Gemmataceae bacterium]|nr:hypothetical protein [Gemmataceae bacterium]